MQVRVLIQKKTDKELRPNYFISNTLVKLTSVHVVDVAQTHQLWFCLHNTCINTEMKLFQRCSIIKTIIIIIMVFRKVETETTCAALP